MPILPAEGNSLGADMGPRVSAASQTRASQHPGLVRARFFCHRHRPGAVDKDDDDPAPHGEVSHARRERLEPLVRPVRLGGAEGNGEAFDDDEG